MLKILFISDIHIANYRTHATMLADGTSNRLRLFGPLADDLATYAEQHGASIIVLGGDLLDRAAPTPEELSTAQYFLSRLANVPAPRQAMPTNGVAKKATSETQTQQMADLIIINGNHDVSVKKESYSSFNSIVSPIVPAQSNVHYVELGQHLEVQGLTFDCHSWRLANQLAYTPADVLVAHGAIIGSGTSDGFIFEHGFDSAELAANYALALCGDIHKPKLFEVEQDSSTRYAIQSGTLMQNNFGDDTQAGFWVIDLEKTEQGTYVSRPEFVHNSELAHGADYYQFVTLDDDAELVATEDAPINRPTRMQPTGRVKLKTRKNATAVDGGAVVNLQAKFAQLVRDNNLNENLIGLFDKLHSECSTTTNRTPTGAKLEHISITNFRSVAQLDFAFPDVPSLLIVGKTGSGKTTLLSAVFFAITGSITKPDSPVLADLPNVVVGAGQPMQVVLDFISKQQKYRIIRSYQLKKDSTLTLLVEVDGEWQSIRREGSKATQQLIYDILGVDDDELFTFCYHSVSGNSSFIDLKNADRYAIISKLAQLDKIDAMREQLKLLDKDVQIDKNLLDGAVAELNRQLAHQRAQQASIMQAKAVAYIDVAAVQASEQQWADYVAQLVEARNAWQIEQAGLNSLSSNLAALTSQQQMLTNQRSQLISEYKQLTAKLEGLQACKCHECGQAYLPTDATAQVQDLQVRIANVVAQGQAIKVQLDELTPRIATADAELAARTGTAMQFDTQALVNAQNQLAQIRNVLQQNAALVEQMAQLDSVQAQITQIEQALADKQPELVAVQVQVDLHKQIAQLIDKKSAFIGALLQVACDMINAELAYVMADLPDYVLRLQMAKEIDILADIGGRRSVGAGTLSAGERKLAQISLLVAFVNVYSALYGLDGGVLGYVFLDEIFSHLDAETLELAKPLVDKCIARQIVVTHEATLQVKYPYRVLVESVGGISRYIGC